MDDAVGVAQEFQRTHPDTLVLVTDKAVAPTFFYYCLTANVAAIVDSKLVQQHVKGDDFGNEWLKSASAGSGPYNLRSFCP